MFVNGRLVILDMRQVIFKQLYQIWRSFLSMTLNCIQNLHTAKNENVPKHSLYLYENSNRQEQKLNGSSRTYNSNTHKSTFVVAFHLQREKGVAFAVKLFFSCLRTKCKKFTQFTVGSLHILKFYSSAIHANAHINIIGLKYLISLSIFIGSL